MRTNKLGPIVVLSAAVFLLLWGRRVEAAGQSLEFKGSLSGTTATIPLDLDADSCSTTDGVTICADSSALAAFAGKQAGGIEAGEYTGQAVGEADPVPGTGCLIAPTTIQSCRIGSVTDGCEFQGVAGDAVLRFSRTGDLEILQLTSSTLCGDLSKGLPANFTFKQSYAITGGTGRFAGATGTFTETGRGQALDEDPQGHEFDWAQASYSGTITAP
jgi:hypothetical protein